MLLLLVLLFCFVFVAAGGYYYYYKVKGGGLGIGLSAAAAATTASSKEVDAAASAIDVEAKKSGLDPDVIKKLAGEFSGVTIGSEGGCLFRPVNGVCKPGFTLVDGCCQLNETDPLKRSQIMKGIAKDVGTSILVSNIAEKLIKTSAKSGAKMAGKSLAGPIGKLAGKLGVKMGLKGGVMAAKLAKNASMGPVGAAMMVFDVVSLALDFADVGGYATFTANSVNTRTRNALEFQLESIAKANNMEYPLLFPVGDAFPEEFESVSGKLSAHFMPTILEEISKKDPKAIEDLIMESVKAEEDGTEIEIPESFLTLFGEVYDTVTKEKHLERDKFLYDEMLKVLPDDKKDHIENFTHMSAPNRMGISLSKKGADAWNAKQRAGYLDKFDALKPKPLPDDYQQPMYAAYTSDYRVVNAANPGKADNPNMVSRKLNKPATLGTYYGMLVAYCEKPRKGKGKTIDLYGQGVRLDPNTGTCRFTQQYCKAMGLKFDGSGDTNCKNYPGQKVAEMIFGTTVTRGAIKFGNQAKKDIKRNVSDITSGNPKKMIKGAVNMLTDPFGIRKQILKKIGLDKVGKKAIKGIGKAGKKVGRGIGKAGKKVGRGLKRLFCLSPETPIKLADGTVIPIKDVKLGDVLFGGMTVDAILQIKNDENPYYRIYSEELKDYVYVTGEHYIQDGDTFVMVKDFPKAELTETIEPVLSCLVTSNHHIPVGEYTFWDWEDNLVPKPP